MKIFRHTKLLAAVLLASQSYQAHSLVIELDISTGSQSYFDTNSAENDGPYSDSTAVVDGVRSYASTSASSSVTVTTEPTEPTNAVGEEVDVNLDDFNEFDAETVVGSSRTRTIATTTTTTNTFARGNSDGSFYLTSSTNSYGELTDDFGSFSTLTQSYTVTNDSAIEQLLDFTFEIENGSISASCSSGPSACETGNYAKAEYEANIFLNGVSIWGSSASIVDDGSGTFGTFTGTALSTTALSSTALSTTGAFENLYSWGSDSFTLNLEALAVGQSFTLDYEVSIRTYASLYVGSIASTRAQFGDPANFGSRNTNSNTFAVPEPASLALMMTGLLGLGVAAKRRRKSK